MPTDSDSRDVPAVEATREQADARAGGRDTLARIAELMPTECTCHEAYSGRRLVDPQCGYHEYGEEVLRIIAEARAPRAEPGAEPEYGMDPAVFADALGFTPKQRERYEAAREHWRTALDGFARELEASTHITGDDLNIRVGPSPQPAGAEPEAQASLEISGRTSRKIIAAATRPSPSPAVEALRALITWGEPLPTLAEVDAFAKHRFHDRELMRFVRALRALLTQDTEIAND